MSKLTEGLSAKSYKLTENMLYSTFYADIFENVYSTTPDYVSNTYSFDIVQKRWNVSLESNNQNWYVENYFPLIGTNPNDSKEYEILEKYKKCVGTVETEILNYIYKGGNRFMLVGKEGWGKTTLLRFISHLIINSNLQYKQNHCIPIYLSFNTKINDLGIDVTNLSELEKKERFDKILYEGQRFSV